MRKKGKKMNKRVKTYIIVNSVIITLLVGAGSTFYIVSMKKVREENARSTQELRTTISTATRSGYIAKVAIDKGAVITEDLVTYDSNLLCTSGQDSLFSENDIGNLATVSIPAGSIISKNMSASNENLDLKEKEFSYIWLSSNLKEHDYVDIRILFPNGEDYIVASKKSLKKPDLLVNNVFLWLTEEEINLLDAACVDANLHGAKIYTTKYVKPEIQDSSIVNYEPNSSVIRLMEDNPNIVKESAKALSVEARREMEKRMQKFKEAHPDFELNDSFASDTTGRAVTPEVPNPEGANSSGSNAQFNPDGTISDTGAGTDIPPDAKDSTENNMDEEVEVNTDSQGGE